jgi:phosphate:Na+ symporter
LEHSSFIVFLSGVAMFVYGLHLASENLQSLSAERIRDIIRILSKKPYWGVFLGMGLTAIFQSSGAVTSMLVGLGAAKVISLTQVMSVILGTAIGSTFTVQLLSFDIARFGMVFFTIGFFIQFLTKRRVLRECMSVLMGFGLLFWGLELVRTGTANIGSSEGFPLLLKTMSENPILTILITSVFTAIVQSSAVTIGLAMTLTGHGLISIEDSIYWIFGANIGTTAVALLSSVGANTLGRQVAWAHCIYKVLGVLIFFPFAGALANWLAVGEPIRDVANINTFYNCVAAILFYPWINRGALMIERFLPPTEQEKEFSVAFLQKTDWESPSVVVAHAEREILRMTDIVNSMIANSLSLFRKLDPDLTTSIRKRDDQTDLLFRELNLYLAKQLATAPQAIQLEMIRLMNYSADLEAAADVVDNQIIELATKTHTLKVHFSPEAWTDLEEISQAVSQIASMSVACFQTGDRDLAAKVIYLKRNVRKMEQRMREAHIARMVKGSLESINTSSIHLDLLGEYRRIVGLMSNHVYPLLKDADPYNILPRRV